MRCAAALLAATSRAAGLRRVTAVQNKPAATTTTIPASSHCQIADLRIIERLLVATPGGVASDPSSLGARRARKIQPGWVNLPRPAASSCALSNQLAAIGVGRA